MIRFTDNHAQRLVKMRLSRILPAIGEELEFGAHEIVEDAAESIRADSISGPGHIPSLPGEPPNADTHGLDQSGNVGDLIETPNRIQTYAGFSSDHAWIEEGGVNMEPRPYLGPATRRNRRNIIEAIGKRYAHEVNG